MQTSPLGRSKVDPGSEVAKSGSVALRKIHGVDGTGSSWKTCSGQSTSVASSLSSSLLPAQWCRLGYRRSHCPRIVFVFQPHGQLVQVYSIEGSHRRSANCISDSKRGNRPSSTRSQYSADQHGRNHRVDRDMVGRWSSPSCPVNRRGPYGVRSTFLSRGCHPAR